MANYRASGRGTAAEKLAVRYSELMATDPGGIGQKFYDELKQHYSWEEIIELGTFIGFNIGYHTFFGTLKFYPMFAPAGRLVHQRGSACIYVPRPASLTGGGA